MHVVVVGSCNIDLVAYAPRVPGPGETILGERFVMGFGGKGANQAVMAARLGAEVSMIGALGDDDYAEMTLRNFSEQGVDTRWIRRVPGASGVAPIWVEPGGTNRIIVVPGANWLLDGGATAEAVRSLRAVDVVVGQLEVPQAATLAGFLAARDRGATTILNPAPAAPLDPELLAATDWLIPNEHELETLPGSPTAGDDEALGDAARLVRGGLLVTLGRDGAAVVWGGRVTRVAAPVLEAVDTTGAGDAFVGAFAVGLAEGLDPIDATRLGVDCASDSVRRSGTQASFPDRARALELRSRYSATSQPPSPSGMKNSSSG
ncbi:MAG TPA: ribokinase [Candidatus Limnocylindrales bacterium]|nr:ribokinase [Candidatus Limnocylindrales bacterium]